jgi:hypothetical protein
MGRLCQARVVRHVGRDTSVVCQSGLDVVAAYSTRDGSRVRRLRLVWGGTEKGAGAFDIGAKPPELSVSNVEFHVGWLDDTVPAFAKQYSGPFAFAHLDAELYSSTKTVFDNLSDWFVAGTIVVFDEYFGYHGWQRHEHKAFQEFLWRTGLEAIGLGHMNLAVRLING